MELRKRLHVPAPRAAEVVMLKVARPGRSEAPGNRPWQSFFVWAFGASAIVVLPVFVLAAFYPGLMASWFGIGALAALVGLLAIATWFTARPVMALSSAAANFQSGDLRARATPGGGGETRRLAETFNAMVDNIVSEGPRMLEDARDAAARLSIAAEQLSVAGSEQGVRHGHGHQDRGASRQHPARQHGPSSVQ
jgi:methyl-accepting chemotaxis protein